MPIPWRRIRPLTLAPPRARSTYAGLSGGIFPTMRKYNGHRLEVMGHIEWCYTTPQLIILLSLYCGKEAPSR